MTAMDFGAKRRSRFLRRVSNGPDLLNIRLPIYVRSIAAKKVQAFLRPHSFDTRDLGIRHDFRVELFILGGQFRIAPAHFRVIDSPGTGHVAVGKINRGELH